MTSVGGLYYSVKCFGDVKGNLKKTQPKPYNINTNTRTYTKCINNDSQDPKHFKNKPNQTQTG